MNSQNLAKKFYKYSNFANTNLMLQLFSISLLQDTIYKRMLNVFVLIYSNLKNKLSP